MGLDRLTSDWTFFEQHLAEALPDLGKPSLQDTVLLRYPTSQGRSGFIMLEGSFDEPAPGGAGGYLMGVHVRLPRRPGVFHRLEEDTTSFPDAARAIVAFLRDEGVPHPGLLTGEAERLGDVMLHRLGIPDHDDMMHETLSGPSLYWPDSGSETEAAIEAVLTQKYGRVNRDADGDYVIDTADGLRFFLSVVPDRPTILFRRVVVGAVESRRAAVIEANYLNRRHDEVRWVLRGHALCQEYPFPTAPFVAGNLSFMLDAFAEAYFETASRLRMRLAADS